MDKEASIALKSIAKELHEINKKLDRLGQASIFNRNSGVRIETDLPGSYSFAYEYEEDDKLAK